MPYHLAGLLSSWFVALSLSGLLLQLREVWRRRRLAAAGALPGEQATAVLSINRFASSFLAFFSMFLYGLTLDRLNLYIVAPRIVALTLLLLILYEIQRDRRTRLARGVLLSCAALVAGAAALSVSPLRVAAHTSGAAHGLVLAAMGLFAQGALHQIATIRRYGRTGALSGPMHQLFLLKDLSSLAFGFAMGVQQGWPVMVFHLIGLSVQSVTLWHFRWARRSPVAEARRAAVDLAARA